MDDEIVMRGTRENVIGLLRLMADEIEQGSHRSATCFSEHEVADPTVRFVVEVDDRQRLATTMRHRYA
jgi:hypothetical protein